MRMIKAGDYADMSRKAAHMIFAQVIGKPDSVIGLATGSTPIGIYDRLADWYRQGDISFAAVRSVNLDEYCGLPASHPESYRSFMNARLFDRIDIKKENTFLPDGMAADYDGECRRYNRLVDSLGGIDIQLLGVGKNGHIGFNEPDHEFDTGTHCVTLSESTRAANARFFDNDASKVPERALTLGIRHIMQAKKIVLAANGREKLDVIERALCGKITPMLPISILQIHPDVSIVYSEA